MKDAVRKCMGCKISIQDEDVDMCSAANSKSSSTNSKSSTPLSELEQIAKHGRINLCKYCLREEGKT